VNFVSDGRILANSTFEAAAHRLSEEHNRHPPISRKFLVSRQISFKKDRFSRCAWRNGVGANLRTNGIKLRVADRDSKEAANLADTI
jgi:hypothetical protein